MPERDAITLRHELDDVLSSKDKVDESQAKRLRKTWDNLSCELKDDNPIKTGIEDKLTQLRIRVHRQVEERNAEYTELEQLTEQLTESVSANDLGASQKLERKIIDGLNRIKGLSVQRRQQILTILESLQPRIKKLESWRQWGSEQARQKIIEEIRQIHDHEKDLVKIAKRIQQAREEWKQWDLSGEGGNHKLYAVFDDVCTKAYDPCKALFEEQRKQRQEATRQRAQVCETLEKAFEDADWHNPDWKAIQKLIRKQTGHWRSLRQADYRDRKPLTKRFDSILKRFHEPLDRERARNCKKREAVIAKAETLMSVEDSRKAILELQELKKEWIVTVSGKRSQEQVLWKRFTTACDAVYERDRESKKAFNQKLQSHLETKQKLCSEMEKMMKEQPENPEEMSSRLRRWKSAWDGIGNVPKRQEQQIEKRYRDAMKEARRHLSMLRKSAQSELDSHLFQRAAICAELESSVLNGNSRDMEKSRNSFDAVPRLQEDLQHAMDSRFETALIAAEDENGRERLKSCLDENFEAINQLLLQLEINAGVDSPPAYARQRMALQIGRLSAALGKAAENQVADDRTLIEKIHTKGAVSATRQAEINQRFTASYEALQSRNQ